MPQPPSAAQNRTQTAAQLSPPLIKRLLYLSDATHPQLDVYDYRTKVQIGTVTGVPSPYGECVDGKGDVYVAEFGGGVLEFAHGGSKPIAQFTTDGYTMGCSVSKKGDLAAGIFDSPSGGQGDIEVFPHGGGAVKR